MTASASGKGRSIRVRVTLGVESCAPAFWAKRFLVDRHISMHSRAMARPRRFTRYAAVRFNSMLPCHPLLQDISAAIRLTVHVQRGADDCYRCVERLPAEIDCQSTGSKRSIVQQDFFPELQTQRGHHL